MSTPSNSASKQGGDYVILLHGIGRTSACMNKLQAAFEKDGYQVLNIDYPSREDSVLNIADKLHAKIDAFVVDKTKKVNFVGYSMGGLVARAYIKQHHPDNMGRAVMLGVPNNGSEVADMLENTSIFNWFYGPAGKNLATSFNAKSVLGAPDYEVGVVAGTWTVDPISYFIIKGPNDGKVSVESAKIENMTDQIVLPVTHTFMPLNSTVIDQTKTFIKSGKFKTGSPN